MIGREPDLTLIIDLPAEAALARSAARGSQEDRFEDFGLAFQEKLRAGFLALAAEAPARCVWPPARQCGGFIRQAVSHAMRPSPKRLVCALHVGRFCS